MATGGSKGGGGSKEHHLFFRKERYNSYVGSFYRSDYFWFGYASYRSAYNFTVYDSESPQCDLSDAECMEDARLRIRDTWTLIGSVVAFSVLFCVFVTGIVVCQVKKKMGAAPLVKNNAKEQDTDMSSAGSEKELGVQEVVLVPVTVENGTVNDPNKKSDVQEKGD